MSEIVLLEIGEDWDKWLWVELDTNFMGGAGDEPGMIVVDCNIIPPSKDGGFYP